MEKDAERRLNAAIALLVEGAPEQERHALANLMRSAYASHVSLVSNAAGVALPNEERRKMRFLYQAVAALGLCLTTLGDVLSGGKDADTRLGGVTAGLDRAICYIQGRPYTERVFKSELDAAQVKLEAAQAEVSALEKKLERAADVLEAQRNDEQQGLM